MNEVFEKQLASCKIDWKIENFCFAFTPDNYTILSPEFRLQGLPSVKWRMSLELESEKSDEEDLVSFYVEKITASETQNIIANFEVTLTLGSHKCFFYGENIEFGDYYKHGQRGIATVDEIQNRLLTLKPDDLFIHVNFIAYNKERPPISDEQVELGLLLLSRDLERLKDTESYPDINLKVGDQYIRAHKAILSRNKTFETYIKEAKNNVIDALNIDYRTLNQFVNFIYSGNVQYLLLNPSLSMIKCIEHFNCDALASYYIPEQMSLHTNIKVDSHDFHWYIPDILERRNFEIRSPNIKKDNVNTTWQFIVSDDPNNFISIFSEIVKGDRPRYFCLEFAIINEKEQLFFPRRLLRTDGNYDNMGFQEFVKTESVFNDPSLTESDCVRFLFRVRTSDGIQELLTSRHIMSLTAPTEVPLYKQLSLDLSELLEKEKYSDVNLKCDDDRIIKAHKCILAARSPRFRQMIVNASRGGENTLTVTYVGFDILKIIINYIYTGICGDIKGAQLITLYKATETDKLDIPSMHEDLKKFLKKERVYLN